MHVLNDALCEDLCWCCVIGRCVTNESTFFLVRQCSGFKLKMYPVTTDRIGNFQ